MVFTRTAVWRSLPLVVLLAAAIAFSPRTHAHAAPADSTTLQHAFATAAHEFGVPPRVLLAVSYHLSRWDDHGGRPSTAGGYGPMHLVDTMVVHTTDAKGEGPMRTVGTDPRAAQHPTLQQAAELVGVSVDVLKHNPSENIRGGAALLAHYARANGALPTNEADWYGAVVRYGGDPRSPSAHVFADDVFATLATGMARTTAIGEHVVLGHGAVTPNRATTDPPRAEAAGTVECPAELACRWAAAYYGQNVPTDPRDYGNYSLADRERNGLSIDYIVIHDTETSYAGTISWFQNPTSYVSTHYVLRSSDGQITQMVANHNVAWGSGNWHINAHAIQLEHEGYAISGASWYTESMYRASARLTRYLANMFGVPLDRAHIVGHDEISGLTPQYQTAQHWDPGPFWDWQHYMELVGAPIQAQGDGGNNIIMINPDFATNKQSFSDVPTQPANMVHLYTAPSVSAPLLDDPAIPGTGTRNASDWGSKAVTGQQFYRFARQGEWDGIYYGGQQAWLYNPHQGRTVPSTNMLVTPKPGRSAIPVYGGPYPENRPMVAARRPPEHFEPLQYVIPAGQVYVAYERVTGIYYDAPVFTINHTANRLIQGQASYYAISFNHRLAFVRAADVDLVTGVRPPLLHTFLVPLARTP